MHFETLCAAQQFEQLFLSVDDQLPTDVELVMSYRSIIPPEDCAAAIQRGLAHFPHLTGVIVAEPQNNQSSIIPAEGKLSLEVIESHETISVAELQSMSLARQSSAFIPQQRKMSEAGSLFQVRLTQMTASGRSVLGFRVSHAAVDGTGLALFIHHCTALIRGVKDVALFHNRSYGFGTCLEGPATVPHGYQVAHPRKTSVWDDDWLTRATPTVFVIAVDQVKTYFNVASILDARLRLGAWLCLELSPHYEELALWCDARGTNGIPAAYTGNAGCFLHFPLLENTMAKLTQQLRSVASRGGFQKIADTYRSIKQAEARGHPLHWSGAGKNVLQLNLVPHAAVVTDFGCELPDYALLLSRNSSGLRIALSVDESYFTIEACLPEELADGLVEMCRAAGMDVTVWCQGEG